MSNARVTHDEPADDADHCHRDDQMVHLIITVAVIGIIGGLVMGYAGIAHALGNMLQYSKSDPCESTNVVDLLLPETGSALDEGRDRASGLHRHRHRDPGDRLVHRVRARNGELRRAPDKTGPRSPRP